MVRLMLHNLYHWKAIMNIFKQPLMRSRRGSMCRYAPCNDLEPGARPDRAAARQAGGVATCAPQPQPQHYHHTTSTFQQPRAAHQRSDRPQTWLKHQALVVRPLPSESARCASRIALNNTKSDLGGFKALKARGHSRCAQTTPPMGLSTPKPPLPRRRTPDVARRVARPRSWC